MVNDQKGPLYKELVTLPSGESFIPEGRDVILPLPRGSKVLPARQTRDLMARYGVPRYAEGVGYSTDSPLFKSLDQVEQRYQNDITVNNDNSVIVHVLKDILLALKEGSGREHPITVNVSQESREDYQKLAERVGLILAQEIQRKSQLKGVWQ